MKTLTEASTLAGEEKLGSESIEHTETKMDSTVWIGLQHSSAFSSGFIGSGVCKIEIQTPPSAYTKKMKIVRYKVDLNKEK